MARGKNNRRRASLDSAPPSSIVAAAHAHPTCMNMNNNPNDSFAVAGPSAFGTNTQDIKDAIDFHWKNLEPGLKNFLLKNPSELNLQRFVRYWTEPSRITNTSPNIAASICGCSWYLALNYMSIGRAVEARALILNGCFLQQCYVSSLFDTHRVVCRLASLYLSHTHMVLLIYYIHLSIHRINQSKKSLNYPSPSPENTFVNNSPSSPMVSSPSHPRNVWLPS